jgi:hypothetical protein
MKIVKDIALALLNATVLLLIVLVIAVFMLLGRVETLHTDLTDGVASKLAPQTERLDRIGAQLEQIDHQLETADGDRVDALREEVAALRRQLPDFSGLENLEAREIARQIVARIVQQLSNQSEE